MKLFKDKRAFFLALLVGAVVLAMTGVFSGIGGLLIISTATDFFDMLTYGFKSLVVLFTPFKNPKDHPRFYEYDQMR